VVKTFGHFFYQSVYLGIFAVLNILKGTLLNNHTNIDKEFTYGTLFFTSCKQILFEWSNKNSTNSGSQENQIKK